MLWATQAKGEGSSTTSNSRHFMALSLLKMHQIFMLAFAGAKSGRRGGSGARCSAASPLTMAFPQLVLKKWRNSCSTVHYCCSSDDLIHSRAKKESGPWDRPLSQPQMGGSRHRVQGKNNQRKLILSLCLAPYALCLKPRSEKGE